MLQQLVVVIPICDPDFLGVQRQSVHERFSTNGGDDWTGRFLSLFFSPLISGRGLLGASNPFLLSWAWSERTQAREQQRLNQRDRLELLVSPAIWELGALCLVSYRRHRGCVSLERVLTIFLVFRAYVF